MQHAIETVVDGFKFRSRLEARWSRFYASLGLDYRYEPEAFDLGSGLVYLPDFWLPELECWVEIKPTEPTDEEREKAARLARLTGKQVYLFYGDVWMPEQEDPSAEQFMLHRSDILRNTHYRWTQCPQCEEIGICFYGHLLYMPCRGCKRWKLPKEVNAATVVSERHFPHNHGDRTTRLLAAYTAARQARFDGWWRNRTGSDLAPRRPR